MACEQNHKNVENFHKNRKISTKIEKFKNKKQKMALYKKC